MKTKEIRKPYLVQRAKFTNIKNEEIVGIDSLLDFDYMGSSEFEWEPCLNLSIGWLMFLTNMKYSLLTK